MTRKNNDARLSTLGDGAAITSANSAFPDAFSSLTTSNGATAVMEAVPKTYIFSGPDTGVSRAEWTLATPRAALEVMFDFTNFATMPDNRLMTLFSTGQNAGCGVNLVGGILRLHNFAGTSLFGTTQTVWNKRVRVYLGQEIGAGTADGELHFDCFFGADADGTTPTTASSYHSSTQNSGTVNFTQARIGKLGSGGAVTVPVEYIRLDDAAYAAIGPLDPPVSNPPVLTYTRQNVVLLDSNATFGGTVTLTQASGPTATISGPDGSGVFTVTLPPSLSQNVVLTMTATNGAGTDVETITLTPTGSTTVIQTLSVYDSTSGLYV